MSAEALCAQCRTRPRQPRGSYCTDCWNAYQRRYYRRRRSVRAESGLDRLLAAIAIAAAYRLGYQHAVRAVQRQVNHVPIRVDGISMGVR